jgi:hypothetical protein|tara:strand:- start:260 stop:565 length:306 start_codon:yes stop_codon:yes gene_type:complete
MDQKFEGTPKSEIRLEGRKVTRSDVTNDWGLRLQWQVKRDGKVIATPAARIEADYTHPDKAPGKYEIVLQMWKYVNYRKNKQREFIDSKFIEISNTVTYTI